jgi:hypothetical protein
VLQQTPIEIRALASPAFLDRGCVNVISLADIKEQAGKRWPRIRANVYDRIDTLLRQRLGPSDFFARIDDTKYLVTMPSSEPEDVNIVCLRVAYELTTNLLGQCDINQIQVCKAVNAGDNQMSLLQIPCERLAILAEKAGLQASALEQPATPASPTSQVLGMKPGDPFSKSVTNQTFNVIEGTEERTKTLTIVHQFVPLWSAVSNAITTYICEPRQIMSLDIPRRTITVPQLTLKERIRIEITTLREGINKLAAHIESGNRFILGVQVSFDVLGTPSGRMEYLNECRSFSNEYRSYLDFIITDVPEGIAHTRLGDLTNTLRPFARGVSATVAPGTHTLAPYQGVGLRAVGFTRHEFIHEHLIRQEDVQNLVQSAKALKLNTFLLGVRKFSVLQMAYDAGVQMLSGQAVAPASPEPRGMTRLAWEDIRSSHDLLAG